MDDRPNPNDKEEGGDNDGRGSQKQSKYSSLNSLIWPAGEATRQPLQSRLDILWNAFTERESVNLGSVAAEKALYTIGAPSKRRKQVPINVRVPASTTRRIMKSDDEVDQMISKDAVVIMGKIIELFVMDLTVRAVHNVMEEDRKIVKIDDIVSGASTSNMFDFLCDTLPAKEFYEAHKAQRPAEENDALQSGTFNAADRMHFSSRIKMLTSAVPRINRPSPQQTQEHRLNEMRKVGLMSVQCLQQQQLSSLYANPSFYSISSIASSIIDQFSEELINLNSQLPSGALPECPSPSDSNRPLPSLSFQDDSVHQGHGQQFQQQPDEFPMLWEQTHHIEYPYRIEEPNECPPITDADIEEEENDLYSEGDEDDDDDNDDDDDDDDDSGNDNDYDD